MLAFNIACAADHHSRNLEAQSKSTQISYCSPRLIFIPALPFCHIVLKAEKPKHFQYPKELKSLGDHIRKRRLDLGLFQKQVAEQILVDEETIWRWERNESRPQIQFLPAIITFLGYNPLPLQMTTRDRLLFCRQLLGLSQRRFAQRIGIDPKALGLAERGKKPFPKKLLKFLEMFDKSCPNYKRDGFDHP